MFNSNKLSVEPLKVKLSVPRAGAKGKIMRGLKMKVVQRTQGIKMTISRRGACDL